MHRTVGLLLVGLVLLLALLVGVLASSAGTGLAVPQYDTSTCTTYNSSDTPISTINNESEGDQITSTITVTDIGTITDITVTVTISHTAVRDIRLDWPDIVNGGYMRIFGLSNHGALGADLDHLQLNNAAVNDLDTITGDGPYTGVYHPLLYPDTAFATGVSAARDWELVVYDHQEIDGCDFPWCPTINTGILQSWSLELCTTGAATSTPTPTVTPTATLTPIGYTPSPTPSATVTGWAGTATVIARQTISAIETISAGETTSAEETLAAPPPTSTPNATWAAQTATRSAERTATSVVYATGTAAARTATAAVNQTATWVAYTLTPPATPAKTALPIECGDAWRAASWNYPGGSWVIAQGANAEPGGGVPTPYGPASTPTATRTRTPTPTATEVGWTPSPTNTPTETPVGWTPSPTVTPTETFTPVPGSQTATGGVAFVAWTAPENAVPPLRPTADPLYSPGARYPLGLESIEYLDNTWETEPTGCSGATCAVYNINWAPYDNDIAAAAAYTVTVGSGQVISQPFSLAIPSFWLVNDDNLGGDGSAGAPYGDRYLPAWLLGYTESFVYEGDYYWGVHYDDLTFKARLVNFVQQAGARFNSNPQVSVVRVLTGVDGESQPVGLASWDGVSGSQNGLMQEHQDHIASCSAYQAFVREICQAAKTAFPDKPVVCMVGPSPCYGWYGYEFRAQLWDDPSLGWNQTEPKRLIGYSGNAIAPDYQAAEEAPGFSFRPWFYYRSGATVKSYGDPVVYEWWANANVGGYDPYQSLYWPFLSGAHWQADFLLPNSTYNNYRTTFAWDVIDYWLGDYQERAWVIFRDAEYRNYVQTDGYRDTSPSGGRGSYEQHLAVMTPTVYPQYCSAAVATEEASKAPVGVATTIWRPCNLAASPNWLPTPNATNQPTTPTPEPTQDFNMMQRLFNRQALAIPAGDAMGLLADATWQYYGDARAVDVTLAYMDIGTGTITVSVATGPSTQDDEVITLANTGLWQRAQWSVAGAVISNTISVPSRGNAFVAIDNATSNRVYLHELYVDVGAEVRGMFVPQGVPTPATARWWPWLLLGAGAALLGSLGIWWRRRRTPRGPAVGQGDQHGN